MTLAGCLGFAKPPSREDAVERCVLKEKDKQSGRNDAEENDGVNQVVHFVALGKVRCGGGTAAMTAAAKPFGIKLAT